MGPQIQEGYTPIFKESPDQKLGISHIKQESLGSILNFYCSSSLDVVRQQTKPCPSTVNLYQGHLLACQA